MRILGQTEPARAASCAATRFQARGVFSAQNNATSVCSLERLVLERLPISLTSLRSARLLWTVEGQWRRQAKLRGSPQYPGRHGGDLRVAPDAFAGGWGAKNPGNSECRRCSGRQRMAAEWGRSRPSASRPRWRPPRFVPTRLPRQWIRVFSVEASAASDASC